MITELEVEKAAAYLRDNAGDYAKAKAERIYLQEFRKSQKAMLIGNCDEKTVQAKESYAYAHSDYIQVIDGLREAVEAEEKLNWLMKAATIKIEIWRTEQANNRNVDRSHQ